MSEIRFGTSGWRAIIADDFTFASVRRAVDGIARYVVAHHGQGAPSLIIGRDPRFLGETCVQLASQVASGYGIHCLVCGEPAPTPAIAVEIRRRGADGAINFTASHNPAEYNGLKFSTPDGAPALPEVTREIERLIAGADTPAGLSGQAGTPAPPGAVEQLDLRPAYLDDLRGKVNLEAIRRAGLKLAIDPFYGAARGYLDHILRDAGIAVVVIHDRRDVLFGGYPPEPSDERLGDLKQAMAESGAHLGLSTDGDADRFGILDRGGRFISPNYIIGLLFDYLMETRGWKAGAGKSVATTNLVNALADHYHVPLYETPVGFKYIGELIKADKIVLGGEESAGLSIYGHVPEKDGILACLLAAEMVAQRGAGLAAQLEALFRKVGGFYPERVNLRLTAEQKSRFDAHLRAQEPGQFAGRQVKQVVRTDGLKLVLDDGSWVLFRASGTEPVVRLYAEARAADELPALLEEGRKFVFG
jgi:phosphoglucomutase